MNTEPTLSYERNAWDNQQIVAGIDEVGRGAAAGPVVHGLVVLDKDKPILGLRDSKELSHKARVDLSVQIQESARFTAIGLASPKEVDTLGLSKALQVSAGRAIEKIPRLDVLLIDGPWDFCPSSNGEKHTIVKGEKHSQSIAAASIIAKVYRDQIMVDMDKLYSGYFFAEHKGYLTKKHKLSITELGPSPIHRLSLKLFSEPTLF